jgi:hypothetical protein
LAQPTAGVETYVSFDWMKRHESKFETFPSTAVQPLASGAMLRKGKSGAAHEDGTTPQIARDLRAFGSHILTDPAAMSWLYEGGTLP